MGKLIYSLNVLLDGFVETPDHGLDWAVVDAEGHTRHLSDGRHRSGRDGCDAGVGANLEAGAEDRLLDEPRPGRA